MKRHGWLLAVSAAGLALGFAPGLWADPNDGPRESHEEELRHRLERLREQAASLASATPRLLPSAVPAPSASAAAPSSGVAEELTRKWAELVATRHDRRERHRADVAREVGARLNDPEVAAELKLHATRLADLARVEFLAQNARRGVEREKLLARIGKLSARESERHRARLAKLLAAPAKIAVSAAPSAPSSPPAPSAEAPH